MERPIARLLANAAASIGEQGKREIFRKDAI